MYIYVPSKRNWFVYSVNGVVQYNFIHHGFFFPLFFYMVLYIYTYCSTEYKTMKIKIERRIKLNHNINTMHTTMKLSVLHLACCTMVKEKIQQHVETFLICFTFCLDSESDLFSIIL